MENKIYVGNLSFDSTEADLEKHFSSFGNIVEVKIIYNLLHQIVLFIVVLLIYNCQA